MSSFDAKISWFVRTFRLCGLPRSWTLMIFPINRRRKVPQDSCWGTNRCVMCRLMGKVVCRVFLMNLCQLKSSALKASRVNRKGSSSQHHPDTSNLQIPCWATHCDPSTPNLYGFPNKTLELWSFVMRSLISLWWRWICQLQGYTGYTVAIQSVIEMLCLLAFHPILQKGPVVFCMNTWSFISSPHEDSYQVLNTHLPVFDQETRTFQSPCMLRRKILRIYVCGACCWKPECTLRQGEEAELDVTKQTTLRSWNMTAVPGVALPPNRPFVSTKKSVWRSVLSWAFGSCYVWCVHVNFLKISGAVWWRESVLQCVSSFNTSKSDPRFVAL